MLRATAAGYFVQANVVVLIKFLLLFRYWYQDVYRLRYHNIFEGWIIEVGSWLQFETVSSTEKKTRIRIDPQPLR